MADVSSLPVPMIGLVVLAAMLLAAGAGQWLRRRMAKRHTPPESESVESVAQEGYLLGAALGTLGLVLAFSYAMVINRYEERRELVVKHANAIGTAYLRTQFLDEPYRSRLSNLLVEYTANRIDVVTRSDRNDAYVANNDRLLTEIWATLRTARESALAHGLTTSILQTYNEMTDLDAERTIASGLRLPEEILVLLICYLVVTAGVVGHQVDGPRGRRAAAALFVLIALSLAFIADINRPMSDESREPEKPMYMLLHSLRAHPPLHYGGDASDGQDAAR